VLTAPKVRIRVLLVAELASVFIMPLRATTISVADGCKMSSVERRNVIVRVESSVSIPLKFAAVGNECGVILGDAVSVDHYTKPSSELNSYNYLCDSSDSTNQFISLISFLDSTRGSSDTHNSLTSGRKKRQEVLYNPMSVVALAAVNLNQSTAEYLDFYDIAVPRPAAPFESTVSSPSPEPATMILFAGALMSIGVLRRNKER